MEKPISVWICLLLFSIAVLWIVFGYVPFWVGYVRRWKEGAEIGVCCHISAICIALFFCVLSIRGLWHGTQFGRLVTLLCLYCLALCLFFAIAGMILISNLFRMSCSEAIGYSTFAFLAAVFLIVRITFGRAEKAYFSLQQA